MPLWLLRLWLGPLPKQEIFPENSPNLVLHWLIHPVKRRLAKYYLWVLQRFFGLKVIALTGSAGKTTTKLLLHAAFSSAGPTVSTADSVTSTYNLPTTILKATPATKYLILEMGVEYPGDMDFYTWLARPDIAIILNVNRTHTHYLGSIASVAHEKSKLFASLPPGGIAVFPADDPHIAPPINAKSMTFGLSGNAYCQILSSKIQPNLTTKIKLLINQQPVTYSLGLLGEHLAANLAATVSCTYALGLNPDSFTSAFTHLEPAAHRLRPKQLKSGALIIDDTYNANPLAVTQSFATLMTLAKLLKKTPVFVFGQMNELGQYEQSAHTEIGILIKKSGLKHLLCHGPATRHTLKSAGFGDYYESKDRLVRALRPLTLDSKYLTLIKASRGWHLEDVIDRLV